jgi:hypothetical protein
MEIATSEEQISELVRQLIEYATGPSATGPRVRFNEVDFGQGAGKRSRCAPSVGGGALEIRRSRWIGSVSDERRHRMPLQDRYGSVRQFVLV